MAICASKECLFPKPNKQPITSNNLPALDVIIMDMSDCNALSRICQPLGNVVNHVLYILGNSSP